MSDLPQGWAAAIGDDLFSSIRGVTYSKVDASSMPGNGLVPILRANNIICGSIVADNLVFVPSKCVSLEQHLQNGDLLIASSSGSRTVVGKAAPASCDDHIYAFGAFCTVARPRTDDLGKWLSAYFRSRAYRDYVEQVALGININNLRGSDLKAIPIPVAPLSEQRRIMAKIDSFTDKSRRARDHLDHIPRLVEKYKQAILAAAFRGDLTREWRAQNSISATAPDFVADRQLRAHEMVRSTGKGRDEKSAQFFPDADMYKEIAAVSAECILPQNWCWTSIGCVFGIYIGATPSRKKPDFWNGDVPWVSSGEVAFCRIAETRETISEKGFASTSTRLHPPGTVLIGMIGEGKTRGQAAILDLPACNNQNCAAIRVSEAEYSAEYVYWYLWSVYENTRNAGAGNNQPALNKDRVQRLLLPLAPTAEAIEIAKLIETAFAWIDRLANDATSARKLIDHLDQSVLAKAFRGELVPQDSTDEPASALLDRIRTERDAAPKSKRGRKKAV